MLVGCYSTMEAEELNMAKVSDFPPEGYELVWSDEFEGTELDSSKWAPRGLGPRRGGIISADCVYVDGEGQLVIETRRVGDEYHSGMIGTQKRFMQRYGYFETRLKFPEYGGQNSGFWLQSPGNVDGGGPPGEAGVEVDIIEFHRGRRGGWANNALHWGGYGKGHEKVNRRRPFDDGNEFHTYGLLWSETGYVWYTDGVETWRTQKALSHVPHFLILSTVVGDRNRALSRAELPDKMLVDYVRVYSVADSAARENP